MVDFTRRDGFLVRSEYFKDTFEFASIANVPCLILLGEPGIGKSHAVKDAVRFVSESAVTDKCFTLDLRSYGSEDRLYEALFKSSEIKEWLEGNYQLHIFLDSFDECLLRVDTVATLLADEVNTGKYPVDRLLFRIASRTADFPRGFENALRQIWTNEEKVKVMNYVATSLDVLEAAETNNLSPQEFLAEIVAREWVAGCRPITLRFR